MLLRMALVVLALVLACRWMTGKWPWALLSLNRQPREKRGFHDALQSANRRNDSARARELLGVGAKANREEILMAHKHLIAKVHPDRGGNAELVHEADAARDILLKTVTDTSGK